MIEQRAGGETETTSLAYFPAVTGDVIDSVRTVLVALDAASKARATSSNALTNPASLSRTIETLQSLWTEN